MQTLKLNGCSKLKSPRFVGCFSLQSLSVSGSKFSNDALLALYSDNGVPNLTHLFAKKCWGLTWTHIPPEHAALFAGNLFQWSRWHSCLASQYRVVIH